MIDWLKITGFNWDEGNSRKNVEKHNVNQAEAEQVYFNQPLIIIADIKHSHLSSKSHEVRFHALGKTDNNRRLHITFTLRSNQTLIRVISARDMHRKERRIYEEDTQL